MPRSRFVPFVALSALAACASRPPAAFPISGESGALARLAGEWVGTYTSPMLGRAGSIVFTFGEGQARGDVVMVPPGQTRPVRPAADQAGQPGAPGPAAEASVLTIEFARAAGDSITGTLSPYHDPDCQCTVQATFVGYLSGDAIAGTFTSSRTIGDQRVRGTWEARRRR